jgi:hypothetical protein
MIKRCKKILRNYLTGIALWYLYTEVDKQKDIGSKYFKKSKIHSKV